VYKVWIGLNVQIALMDVPGSATTGICWPGGPVTERDSDSLPASSEVREGRMCKWCTPYIRMCICDGWMDALYES